MKIKTTFFTFVMLISVNLSAQTQLSFLDKVISIKADNEILSEVLKQVERLGNVTLAYSNEAVDVNRRVAIQADGQTVRTVLAQLFYGTNLLFEEQSNKILIYANVDQSPRQITQTVRGTVIDPESNQPIIGANVIILGSNPLLGSPTDAYGRFKIEKVPVGRHDFQITFMGYKTKTLSSISVDSGKEVVLNIGMEESVTALNEVVVTAELDKSVPLNDMAMVSAKSFTVEETSKYAGSFNDPARMATTYAGVTGSTDDTENSIIIRGNSPRGLLWRLEGMEIPNPNHFASDGASNGAISMLNSNVLANSDFLTGAFPAEYGNAFSGVFDLKLRNGNNENKEYALQAGLLGLDASFEGPIRRKSNKNLPNASYLINYRYSTISMLESLGLDIAGEGGQVPAFQDLAFKFHVPTRNMGTFSFYGLGGKSISTDLNTLEVNTQFYDLDSEEKYRMGLIGMSHIYSLSAKSFIETSISGSQTRYNYFDEELDLTDISSIITYTNDLEDYRNSALRFASTLSTKFNARHSTKFGFIYSALNHDLGSEGFLDSNTRSYRSDEKGNMGMVQGFVSHKINLTDQLTMTGGFHYLRLDLAGQESLEPRFGLKWQFKSDQSLSLGAGLHSRREETSLYFTELADGNNDFTQPNTTLGLGKARHLVVGYDRNFGEDFHLKLEAYYQDLYDIPVSSNPNSDYSSLNQEDAFQRFSLVNEGKGKNYGIELTLEKFLSKGYFFLLTGSIYESKYTTLKGIEYDSRYNGKYNGNFVAGREFNLSNTESKKKTLSFGIETVFAGGTRAREIDLNSSIIQGEAVYFQDRPFGKQLKDYARIDFQVALKTNKKKVTHELKLDVQNLTSRSNVIFERYIPSTQQIRATSFTGELIPVLSYKVTF